jgi:hypothetical protein
MDSAAPLEKRRRNTCIQGTLDLQEKAVVRIYPLPLLLLPLPPPLLLKLLLPWLLLDAPQGGVFLGFLFSIGKGGQGWRLLPKLWQLPLWPQLLLPPPHEYFSVVKSPGLKRGTTRGGSTARGGQVEGLMEVSASRCKDLQLQLCLLLNQSRKDMQPSLKPTSVRFKMVIKVLMQASDEEGGERTKQLRELGT